MARALFEGSKDRERALGAIHYVEGFFADTLPGPVRRLSILRCDSDLYVSTLETLERLYPKLSVGGYVVFDDWKLAQSRGAVLLYRRRNGITSPVWGSSMAMAPPFQSIDRIAFWRKEKDTG